MHYPIVADENMEMKHCMNLAKLGYSVIRPKQGDCDDDVIQLAIDYNALIITHDKHFLGMDNALVFRRGEKFMKILEKIIQKI